MSLKVLDPKELRESGLLYHINETCLWPLGLALAVEGDPNKEDDPWTIFGIIDYGEVVQDGVPETRAKANQWLAERYRTVKP